MKKVVLSHKHYKHKISVNIDSEFKLVAFTLWLNENSHSYRIESVEGEKLVNYNIVDGLIYTNIDSKRSLSVDLEFTTLE